MNNATERTRRQRTTGRSGKGHPGLVHQWFEEQAKRTPSTVAVGSDGQAVSYGELNDRANRLAARLRLLGVGPETLVGVCLGRSVEMVVALLGVLKAGGAYLPVDPTLPESRLEFMLGDARVAVLITEQDRRESLPIGESLVLCIDSGWADDPVEADQSASGPIAVAAENLAYVIYTSGSTGRPKGVQVTHGALANFLASMKKLTSISPDDILLATTTLSFDIAMLEVFLPLVVGGRVEIVSRDVAADGPRLAERLNDPMITFFQATPASWRMLLDAGWKGRPDLKMLSGGEALPRPLADRLVGKGETLWNVYGPTETTIYSSVSRVEPGEGSVPIGRAIASTRLYVVDRNFQLVPFGVTGELYIGGIGVARGYLGRPSLTAERFVPDPFGEVPGGRLYRTGDLVRWRADSQLESIGRVDHQLKIRGHRVEPGEVEAVLARHSSIRQVVVVGLEDGSGELGLVAYLTIDQARPEPVAAELRKFAGESLPEPMVPSRFVILDVLPLTHNGKVDRAALPDPNQVSSTNPGPEFVPPRGATEAIIAAAWSSVLGRPKVGAFDNFFDLGGHSLLATRVMSRIRDATGVEIPLRVLFESPTVAGLAGLIDQGRRALGTRESAPIERSVVGGPQSLSFAQEALWLLHQLAPDQPTFNVTAAVRVAGPLDLAALGRAVNDLVRRHESLRTTFEAVGGRQVMVVAPELELSLTIADLAGLPSTERDIEAARRALEESRIPFDLARGPLARVVVLRLGDRDHAVLLAMHHVMTDGWSFGVAAGELAILYEAQRLGQPNPLPELPIQYADFARWQREQRRGAAWTTRIENWRRRLASVPALELPTDRPRPPVRSTRGSLRPFSLTGDLSAMVRDRSREVGVTPFMMLLAAFQVVLSRWSGQDDFAVGTPVANRTRAETEGLIGYFVNMLALRADLSGDPTGLDLLAKVREASIEAFEDQEIPLEVIIDELAPRRDPSRTPLFQVMFVLQNNALPDTSQVGLKLAALELPEIGTGTTKFELALAFADMPDGFLGSVEYSVDLFDESTIDRLTTHYERVLRNLLADPSRRLSELSLLADDERRLVVDQWSGSGRHPGLVLSVVDRFEANVLATPDAASLVAGLDRLTYAMLNDRANRLAHLLVERGVGPEVRVALALTWPANQLAAVLGVLKAGGAYVPLDPLTPAERLRAILVDSGASVAIIDGGESSGRLDPIATIIDLDDDVIRSDLASRSPANPTARAHGSNLAYVIFTSGSTGRPKGVEVARDSLAVVASAWLEAYELDRRPMAHLQAAPFAFDVFTGDWLRTLGSGGSLVACPREALINPPVLVDLMRRERIGCVELVPVVAEALASELERRGGGGSLPDLLLLAVGSDTLRSGLHERLRGLVGPTCRLVNSYGLTEATIDSSFFEGPCPGPIDRPVPIGRPLPGTRLYVLDRAMRPCPPGVAGELHVGGSGLARGYASDPTRTADRFVPDPFDDRGGRLYRTGDRARWTDEGLVELLGRLDDQVKVRGHRVELGEVEAALLRHESVREAVVVANPGEPDGVRLVAYIAGYSDRSLSIEEIRRALRDRLPRPMIPSRIVAVDALPRTPAGKVDRDALPVPSPFPDDGFVEPRDDVERRLVAIWEGLLDVRPIGAKDDFFDLGGHSLLAVRLSAKVEEEFGRVLPLSDLFQATTIEALADRLRGPALPRASSPLITFGSSGRRPSLAMVHPVGGGVICYGQLARLLEAKFGLFGFQSIGLEGDGEPEANLRRMAARYVEALVEAQPNGPYRLGGWSMGGLVAFEMARQLEASGREVALVVLLDTRAPGLGLGRFFNDERDALAAFAADLVRSTKADPSPVLERLKTIDVGSIPAEDFDPAIFGPELLAEFGPLRLRRHFGVYRANRRASTAYRGSRYLGRAILIRASESDDSSSVWAGLIRGGLTIETLPGDHVSLLQKPNVERVAEILVRESGREGRHA